MTKNLLSRAGIVSLDHRAGGRLPGGTEPRRGRKTSVEEKCEQVKEKASPVAREETFFFFFGCLER